MAPRGRTANVDDDFYRSGDSSPDPLALSISENSAKPARTTSPRKPLRTTSPSKQNRRLSLSEMELSSPSKSMIVNTPRMGGASPWRIKVTVQAEPGSEGENADSPSVKRVTRTQTTTVPLKDPDAPSPVKRGRGRPRKSDIGVAAKPKRTGTPAKRTARSKSREANVSSLDLSAANVDADAPPKRKRGRPRKSIQPVTSDADVMPSDEHQGFDELAVEAIPENSRSTPVPENEHLDGSSQSMSGLLLSQQRKRFSSEHRSPAPETTPRPSFRKQPHGRKGTPHARKLASVVSLSDEESDVLTPSSGAEEEDLQLVTQNTEGVHIMADAATNTRLGGVDDHSHHTNDIMEVHTIDSASESDMDDDGQDKTNYAFDEGTTRMPDDTTVIDSENFSMISVDSLPSSSGFTSPAVPDQQNGNTPRPGSTLRPASLDKRVATASTNIPVRSSPVPTRDSQSLQPQAAARPAIRRYITPVGDNTEPSVPPAIQPAQPSPATSEAPRLGRVVTAGVALQGVLDPDRLTPGPTQRVVNEERDRLDDLFRGFSEGTRKELQAGLRLGEQLAQDEGKAERSSASSTPSAGPSNRQRGKGIFKTERKIREPRLLTPEDQEDDVSMPADQAVLGDVQYPELQVDENASQLLSPAGSVDEMSWRLDTPPVTTGNTERMRMLSVQVGEPIENDAPNQSAIDRKTTQPTQEDYTDIWQEEASRSSNSLDADTAPQMQDLFEPGVAVPARGKLPRTWRRKSGNHFQYSDEAESPQQPTAESTAAGAQAGPQVEPTIMVEDTVTPDEDGASISSDDTGIFFQSNLPNLFSKRHSRELKQKKADKLDLTLLMKEGESLLPDTPPVVQPKTTSTGTTNNPFLDTPPRFAGYLSSPKKSSPLRQELRGSDISSQSPSHFQEESSLPLPQSSPFHTYVEDQSMDTVASDQRQLYVEMEGVTDSSIRRVRNEADEYLDAYEAQERTLHEIEEVTEHSRTWHKNQSAFASSPPQLRMLSPVRKRRPLFGTPDKPAVITDEEPEAVLASNQGPEQVEASSSSTTEQEHPAEEPSERPTGLLTRMTSTLWSAVTKSSATEATAESLPPHPLLAKLTPLPKIEPWTKTHYKTLDKIYGLQYKRPELFSPSATPTTALAQTNTRLLKSFFASTKKRYVGAVFSAWGYEMVMTEELVVLCALFMELLSLDSIEEYEALKGREIELGDCLPKKAGVLIEAEEVARRLATVVLGEEVRKDEKRGVRIDRRRTLEVFWPQ